MRHLPEMIADVVTTVLGVIGLVTVLVTMAKVLLGSVSVRGHRVGVLSWPADLVEAVRHRADHRADWRGEAGGSAGRAPFPPQERPAEAEERPRGARAARREVPQYESMFGPASPVAPPGAQLDAEPLPARAVPDEPAVIELPRDLPELADLPPRAQPLPEVTSVRHPADRRREAAVEVLARATPEPVPGDPGTTRPGPSSGPGRHQLVAAGQEWRDGEPQPLEGLWRGASVVALIHPPGLGAERLDGRAFGDRALALADDARRIPDDATVTTVERARVVMEHFLAQVPVQAWDGRPAAVEMVLLVEGETGLHLVGGHLGAGATWLLTREGVHPVLGNTTGLTRVTWERRVDVGDRLVLTDGQVGSPDQALLASTVDDAAMAAGRHLAPYGRRLALAVVEVRPPGEPRRPRA